MRSSGGLPLAASFAPASASELPMFGANRGPRPSTDSADGLAFPTKMKAS